MRERRGFGTNAGETAQRADQLFVLLDAREPDEDLGLDSGGGELGAGALAVAAVGTEHEPVGQDGDPSVRAGEPGQPPHVGEVRHEQRLLFEPLPDSIGAIGVTDRRKVAHRSSSAIARTASRSRERRTP